MLNFFRLINYDERDLFLCNVCGFCKYVKFDYIFIVRLCCVVDLIENEEDWKKVNFEKNRDYYDVIKKEKEIFFGRKVKFFYFSDLFLYNLCIW